jgi:hypothetical protein
MIYRDGKKIYYPLYAPDDSGRTVGYQAETLASINAAKAKVRAGKLEVRRGKPPSRQTGSD